jgi:hypothetical protein
MLDSVALPAEFLLSFDAKDIVGSLRTVFLEDRQMRTAALFALFLIVPHQTALAGPEDEVHARFEQWITTFNTHDVDRVSQLYDQNARLLSTGGSEKPLDGRQIIHDYFIPFFKRGDTVAFDGPRMVFTDNLCGGHPFLGWT